MKRRHAWLRAVLVAAGALLVFAGPSFGVSNMSSGAKTLHNFARSAPAAKPTAAQRAAVRAIHAKATWNAYGTPSTLMRPGGYLSKGTAGRSATAGARWGLTQHSVIFRLDGASSLSVPADSKLSGSTGHSVTFQQNRGGFKAVNGEGLITVSLRPARAANRWKVGFVSSTSIGTPKLKGAVKLTPAQAFGHAAGNAQIKSASV